MLSHVPRAASALRSAVRSTGCGHHIGLCPLQLVRWESSAASSGKSDTGASDFEDDLTQPLASRKPAADSSKGKQTRKRPRDMYVARMKAEQGDKSISAEGSASAGASAASTPGLASALDADRVQLQQDALKKSVREHLERLRAIDSFALSSDDAASASALGDDDRSGLGMRGAGSGAAEPGLPVDYCVFCYHGTSILRHDNTALLSKFVTDRGSILPKRFTKCCAKHQRQLVTVIKRARWLNLIPFLSKLHPKLRYTSLRPDPAREGAVAAGGSRGAASAADVLAGLDREAPLQAARKRQQAAILNQLNKMQ